MRGFSLLSTLLMIGLAIVLAFAIASIAVYHTTLGLHAHDDLLARQAAQSAAMEAIYNLRVSNAAFGRPSPTPLSGLGPDTLADQQTIQVSGPEGSVGIVTFRHDLTHDGIAVAWSTHNDVEGLTSVPVPTWWPDEEAPANAVDLVATGWCGSEVRRLDVLLNFPPFPYALATTGTLQLQDSVVGGLAAPLGSPAVIPSPADLNSADVASNADVVLQGADCHAIGNVQAVNLVQLEDGAQVDGAVTPQASPVPIPQVPLRVFDPQQIAGVGASSYVTDVPPDAARHGTALAGFSVTQFERCGGTLTVNGNLSLGDPLQADRGGLLFVDGDLILHGAVSGHGAIVVTGNVQIDKGAHIQSTDQTALLAGGNVTLTGADASYDFRGFVWCGGNFQASHITLLGAFAAQGMAQVTDARVIYDAPATQTLIPATIGFLEHVQPTSADLGGATGGFFSVEVLPPGTTSAAIPPQIPGQLYNAMVNVDVISVSHPGVYTMTFQRRDNQTFKYVGPESWTLSSIGDVYTYLAVTEAPSNTAPAAAVRGLLTPTPPAGGVPHVVVDPSRFLPPADRLRVLLWRER